MIYVIRAKNQGQNFLKIGYSKRSVAARLTQAQVGCPLELEVVKVFRGSHASEQTLHLKLSRHHARGEWFHDNDEVRSVLGIGPSEPVQAVPLSNQRHREIDEALFKHRGQAVLLDDFCFQNCISDRELRSHSGRGFFIEPAEYMDISHRFSGPRFDGERALIFISRG